MPLLAVFCRPFPHHASVLSGSGNVLFILACQIKLCVDIPVKIMIIWVSQVAHYTPCRGRKCDMQSHSSWSMTMHSDKRGSKFRFFQIQKRINIAKHIPTVLNIFENVWTYPNISKNIRIYLNKSEQIHTYLYLSILFHTYP